MVAENAAPQPTTIQKLTTAVYPSFAMLAGMQLDVFTPLKDGPMTAAQLADALDVKPEKLSPLLYALVAAELLTVDGARFANTPEAHQFLVQGKPTYMGDQHEFYTDSWSALLQTAASIRSGRPQAQHNFSTMSVDELAIFLRNLHPQAVIAGQQLVGLYDFTSHQTLVDAGGGTGGMALAITNAYPHLQATVIDLPSVVPVTQRCIEENRATDRIQVNAANVVEEPLPGTYDVAVLRSLLQVLSPEQAFEALRHICAAIHPGGVIHIVGRILDDSRLSPLETVGFNLVFLNVYRDGCACTEREHRDWLTTLGFDHIERKPLTNGFSVITAHKPA
ncbi:methyltransferase [Candidatus Entotheonella palauensis]|nr:methyltransferase [Candidatus Entotheonella palauensis]